MNKKIRINEDTIWEETGNIRVYNYPPEPKTQSYVCKIYREYKQGSLGSREVEGEAISFSSLYSTYLSLATIIGEAQVILNRHIETPTEWKQQ